MNSGSSSSNTETVVQKADRENLVALWEAYQNASTMADAGLAGGLAWDVAQEHKDAPQGTVLVSGDAYNEVMKQHARAAKAAFETELRRQGKAFVQARLAEAIASGEIDPNDKFTILG